MDAPTSLGVTRTAQTSLGKLYAVTFLNSLGTGVVTNGIFFLTKNSFGFTQAQNFILGIVLGVTYIFGAMGAGSAISVLKGVFPVSPPAPFFSGSKLFSACAALFP